MNQIVINPQDFNSDPTVIKNLIHLLNGKPDSTTETFNDSILVDKDSLKSLYNKIENKICTLNSQTILTIAVALSENKVLEFGKWESFYNYDWVIEPFVKNIHFKWDFFIQLPDYLAPQRHTLSVKILSDCNFLDLLPLIFTKSLDQTQK